MDEEKAAGVDLLQYAHSKVVIQTLSSLDSHAAGGGDRPEDQSDDPDKVKYVSRTQAEAAVPAGVPAAAP